jgi:hypothetical protein
MTFEQFVIQLEKDFKKILKDANDRSAFLADNFNIKETLFQVECLADLERSKDDKGLDEKK